ncbi:lantibiotic dehydratase [Micromonospora inyonensis]|uniref:Thiopeptide-type bacteriocin biosynthesis domain-containing protein n=1 Tax=Micromonospora inyonensis TaxID=47866 RepID=A0A1C6RLG0_9ACTN|nr:lantibiotic dehydratase [Micromonospora inyonensis]SCL17903.1 thiopeptide-type bacteriocin biosynthesis domain-containing protein [Micromonospora inyonensis]
MYRSVNDALMLRAAVLRPGQLGAWPDLTSSDAAASWRPWLAETLTIAGFGAALAHASPELAERATTAVSGSVSQVDARRVVLAIMRYLLRASTRATPYGLFAGIAPVTTSRTGSIRWGSAHRPFARLQAPWLATVLDGLESDARLRPHLMVRANNLLVERAGKVVLEYRAATSDPRGAPTHLRIKASDMIRVALALAAEPIRWADLTGKLTAKCGAPAEGAERLTGQMVSQRLLLTNLRPPSTETDPLTHLVDQLETAAAEGGDVGELLAPLRRVRDLKARHDGAPDEATADARRRDLGAATALAHPGHAVGVDLRLDCDLVVPTTVTVEACRAAAALTRLARPTSAGWRDWHVRFLNRYGLHALVPLLDAIDAQVGLGYPDGFTGEPANDLAVLTDRDRGLLALAQRAALRREHEVVLDDTLLERLAGAAPTEIPPTAELTVRVHADSLQAIADGDFQLSVVRASAQAFSTAGRFLDLLGETERRRFASCATDSSPASGGALLAQLSAVTRYTISLDVNRASQVLPHLIPVGEYHAPSQAAIGLDDIAITADAHRLYLVSISRQRALQPVAVNAVEPVRHAHPLARFLAEAPVALATPCSPVEWGPAAKGLPFLPALRYGRTLLSPARWHLTAAELPDRKASWQHWNQALAAWLEATGCPTAVSLGTGDQTIGVDLDKPAHRALLRDHLTRNPTALLRVIAEGDGWIGGHPHEIVIPLTATTPRPPAPRLGSPPVDVRTHGSLPGSDHHYLKIYARPEEQTTILSAHLPRLLSQRPEVGRWWFLRHADPEPHVRLRISGLRIDAISGWTRELTDADLTRRVQWDTDFAEPGRFGSLAAYRATTAVFAADSAAALAQLAVTQRRPALGWQALTAASMVDLVTAVIGDPHDALRWLVARTRTHRPAPPRAVYDQAIRLANPYDPTAVASLPDGENLMNRWAERRRTVAAWRDSLPAVSTVPPAELLPDLLHLHHVRVAGLDLDSERACLHLARAAALSWTTRSTP